MQEIDFLTEDKMEYDEFLRAFSVTEEVMKTTRMNLIICLMCTA